MSSIRKSLFLSFLDKYSALLINIGAGLLLARILTPYDIGVYSIAASLYGLASSLRDFGISPYLIQEKELTVSRQRSAMGVIAVISWTLGVLLIAASGFIADFYKNPDLRKVIQRLRVNTKDIIDCVKRILLITHLKSFPMTVLKLDLAGIKFPSGVFRF